jgi:hypothetical protein
MENNPLLLSQQLMASADATCQAIWLKLLSPDLGIDIPVPILNDNQAAIALSKNPVHHECSKHIALTYCVKRLKISPSPCLMFHLQRTLQIFSLRRYLDQPLIGCVDCWDLSVWGS